MRGFSQEDFKSKDSKLTHLARKRKKKMIIPDRSSSCQKNPRNCPNAHMLQPNGFILFNAYLKMYFSKKNSITTNLEFQLYYNLHDYAC